MVLFLLVVPHPAQSDRKAAAPTLWMWKQATEGLSCLSEVTKQAELGFQVAELAR